MRLGVLGTFSMFFCFCSLQMRDILTVGHVAFAVAFHTEGNSVEIVSDAFVLRLCSIRFLDGLERRGLQVMVKWKVYTVLCSARTENSL